jgi:hypothetical protein
MTPPRAACSLNGRNASSPAATSSSALSLSRDATMRFKVKDAAKQPGEEPASLANRKLLPDEATLESLKGLGRLQCTNDEAATFFGVSTTTFVKFLDDFPVARDSYERGIGLGKIGLRRTQWKHAAANVAMAIFLGKNYLGQTDKSTLDHGNKDDKPFQVVIESEDKDL